MTTIGTRLLRFFRQFAPLLRDYSQDFAVWQIGVFRLHVRPDAVLIKEIGTRRTLRRIRITRFSRGTLALLGVAIVCEDNQIPKWKRRGRRLFDRYVPREGRASNMFKSPSWSFPFFFDLVATILGTWGSCIVIWAISWVLGMPPDSIIFAYCSTTRADARNVLAEVRRMLQNYSGSNGASVSR